MANIWATRVANQPVMVGRTDAEWLQNHLIGAAAAHDQLQARLVADKPLMQSDGFWPDQDSWLCSYRPYNVILGTLYIPIKGMLIHDYGYQIGDWLTGYTYIAKAFERGMEDPEVERIAMVVSSAGGEVAGNFDLVDKIFSMRGTKPIQAFVNEAAYSAAYSLASAADKISMTRTSGVGSIGVVTSHVDLSGMMEKNGVKVTFVYAGAHKVDGNPYQELPDDVKNRMQARIDSMYDIFVSTVARNRGVDEQAIRDTEALTYSAPDAITAHLADEVLPYEDAVAAFSGALDDDPGDDQGDNTGDESMTITQEDLDQARAEGVSQGQREGATAERTRINGILTAEAAQNRREVAFHLALNTNQTVEEAVGLLAVTPEKAVAPVEGVQGNASNAFREAMNGSQNPNIQPSGDEPTAERTEQEETMALFRQVNHIKKDNR